MEGKKVIFMACLVVMAGVFASNTGTKAQQNYYAVTQEPDYATGLGGYTLLFANNTNDTILILGDGEAIIPFGISSGESCNDTNAGTICSGSEVFLDGEGVCDDTSDYANVSASETITGAYTFNTNTQMKGYLRLWYQTLRFRDSGFGLDVGQVGPDEYDLLMDSFWGGLKFRTGYIYPIPIGIRLHIHNNGLVDVGDGSYTLANGDNDLGVEGDLEVNGEVLIEGNVTANDFVYGSPSLDLSGDVESYLISWEEKRKPDGSYDHSKDIGFFQINYTYNITIPETNETIEVYEIKNVTSFVTQYLWLEEMVYRQSLHIKNLEKRIETLEAKL